MHIYTYNKKHKSLSFNSVIKNIIPNPILSLFFRLSSSFIPRKEKNSPVFLTFVTIPFYRPNKHFIFRERKQHFPTFEKEKIFLYISSSHVFASFAKRNERKRSIRTLDRSPSELPPKIKKSSA